MGCYPVGDFKAWFGLSYEMPCVATSCKKFKASYIAFGCFHKQLNINWISVFHYTYYIYTGRLKKKTLYKQ